MTAWAYADESGTVTHTTLPNFWRHEDGSFTEDWSNASPEQLSAAGWKPLVEEKPAFDPETQHLAGPEYVVEAEQIRAVYTVQDNEVPAP